VVAPQPRANFFVVITTQDVGDFTLQFTHRIRDRMSRMNARDQVNVIAVAVAVAVALHQL